MNISDEAKDQVEADEVEADEVEADEVEADENAADADDGANQDEADPALRTATAGQAPNALIYIPGLGKRAGAKDVAARLASALDIHATSGEARFHSAPGASLKYGGDEPDDQYESIVYTVTRDLGQEADEPLIDVYRLDYSETLTGSWKERNLIAQTFLLGLTIIGFVLISLPVVAKTIVALFARPIRWVSKGFGKRPNPYQTSIRLRDVLQLLVILALFAVFLAYEVFLVIALVETFRDVSVSRSDVNVSGELTNSQSIVIIATALGFASPKKLKAGFVDIVTNYLTVAQYLLFGSRLRSVQGQLDSLVERVQEVGDYDQVDLVAYSFGTIVAIDALLPPDREPPPRYQQIGHFVTIGCPVDFVRAYRKNYYSGRVQRANVPTSWTNIYIPTDVLASNFRDDHAEDDATFRFTDHEGNDNNVFVPSSHVYRLAPGRTTSRTLALFSWVFLVGFNAHGQYWGDRPSDNDAGGEVVRALYAGGGPLA